MIHSNLNTKEINRLHKDLIYHSRSYKKAKLRLRQAIYTKRAMVHQGFFDSYTNFTISFYLTNCKSAKRELRKTANSLREKMYG